MKRITALILFACLLFAFTAGCGSTASNADNAADGASAAETDTVTVSGTTASGITVHTDYSNYSAYNFPEAVYTRLSDDYIADLEASDSYGAIYPFTGTALYAVDYSSSYPSGYTYGFIDETGCIIADPTYTDVSVLTYYDQDTLEIIPMPFYTISRNSGTVVAEEEYDYSYVEGDYHIGLASADGSMVTGCDYTYISGFEDGVLCANNNDNTFTFYDLDGNVIFTDKDLPASLSGKGFDIYTLNYSSGYFCMSFDEEYYYFNENGEILCGPFYSADGFRSGYAVVYDEDWNQRLIDPAGNYVLDGTYDSLFGGFHNDRLVTRRGENIELLDSDLNVLATFTGTNAGINGNRLTIENLVDSDNYIFDTDYYDTDGDFLYAISSEDWTYTGVEDIFYKQLDDGSVLMKNLLTDSEKTIADCESVNAFYTMDSAADLPFLNSYHYDADNETSNQIVFDLDFNEILHVDDGYVYAMSNELSGEWYIAVMDGDYSYSSGLTLYDQYLNPVASGGSGSLALFGSVIRKTDFWSCTYTDMDGNVFFCYPMLTSLDD